METESLKRVLFTRLDPSTLARMVSDIENTPCDAEAEEVVNLIIRNGEAAYGETFTDCLNHERCIPS